MQKEQQIDQSVGNWAETETVVMAIYKDILLQILMSPLHALYREKVKFSVGVDFFSTSVVYFKTNFPLGGNWEC